jgi:hypothetical protein
MALCGTFRKGIYLLCSGGDPNKQTGYAPTNPYPMPHQDYPDNADTSSDGSIGSHCASRQFSVSCFDQGRYILVVASEKPTVALGIKAARAWVDAGARYICAWGPDSEEVHESFDYAGFLPECGEEVELVTTAHKDEPIEEALWFAFNCAKSVDTEPELNVVLSVAAPSSIGRRAPHVQQFCLRLRRSMKLGYG